MILRYYTSSEEQNLEYDVIETSYSTVKDSNNKIRYLFFKLKFNDLDKNLEVSKLQFLMNYLKIQSVENMRIYGTDATSVDQSTIEDIIYRIENNHYHPTNKEYIFEDTSGNEDSVHSAVFDLNELNMELSDTKNSVVFFIKFNFDIDERLEAQINNTDDAKLIYRADAIFANYTSSLNSLSKVDTYELDKDSKVIVDNRSGELYYGLNLINTLSNKFPINLSVVGHKNNVFSKNLFSKPLRFTFQKEIEVVDNKVVYVKDAYNDLSRYVFVYELNNFDNINESNYEKYKKYIKTHDGDTGLIFLNEMDNTYLYYYKSGTRDCFKIYDKNDNYSLYENSDDITKLKKVCTNEGKSIVYTWDEWRLTAIENDYGDYLILSYNSDNYLRLILDERTNTKVEIEYNTDTIDFKYYYHTGALIKTITLTFLEETSKLKKIYSSYISTLLEVDYYGIFVKTITRKLVKTELDGPIIINPPISTIISENGNDNLVQPAEIVPVVPVDPIDPIDPIVTTTYVTLDEYTYTIDGFYTDLVDLLNRKRTNCYDDLGRCVLEMDDSLKAESKEYYGSTPYLSSKSILVNNDRIDVQNNSFEIGNINNIVGWNLTKGQTSIVKIDDNGRYGKCLKIIKRANEEVKLTQDVLLEAGKTYRLGVFSKYSSMIENGLVLSLKGSYLLENETSFEVKKDTISGTSSSWSSIITEEITIPENATNINAIIELYVKGEEEQVVYFDEVTILSKDKILRMNFIKNSHFDFVENNRPKDWILENTNENDGVFDDSMYGTSKYMKFGKGSTIKINTEEKVKKMYQVINHKGTEGERFTLSTLCSCLTVFYDQLKAYVKFNYDDETSEKFEFEFLRNCDVMQMLSKTVSPSKCYVSIEVGVEYIGNGEVKLHNIQLCKEGSAQYYNFNKIGNITEVSNGKGELINIKYNSDNKIELLITSDGTTYRYTYEDNKVASITDSKGTKISYEYDGDNITSQTIDFGDTVITNNFEYDEDNNLIRQVNEFNKTYERTFDLLHRITTDTTPGGLESSYTYDMLSNLLTKRTTLNNEEYKNTLTYINPNKIQKVQSLNGSTYIFTYDEYSNITKITMDGVVLNNFTYKEVNEITTGLIDKKTSNNLEYTFNYDEKYRLISIYNGETLVSSYEYDENDNICVVNDALNSTIKYFTYDLDNRLIRITTNKNYESNFYYDNHNNVQKINRTISNKNKSVEFDYEYETNEFTFDAYVDRLARIYRDEIIAGTSKGKGRNGTPNKNENFSIEPTLTEDNIMAYQLTKGNCNFTYDSFELNEDVKDGLLYGKPYDKKEYFYKYQETKSYFMWIKPKNDFSLFNLFYARNTLTGQYIEDIIVSITNEGKLKILDKKSVDFDGYVSNETLLLNEWNFVGIKIKNKTVYLYLNGKKIKEFTLVGEYYSCYGLDFFKTNLSSNSALEMPIDVAMISIGCYDYTDKDIRKIYAEGMKSILFNSRINRKTSTRYSVGTFENNYNIITLNGTLESNKNLEPVVLAKAENSYNLEKNNIFDYDYELGRYVYSSFDGDNSEMIKEGILGYRLGLEEEGVISVKFKLVGETVKPRYIFCFSNYEFRYLGISVLNNLLKLNINHFNEEINAVEILNDVWYTLTLFINKNEDNTQTLRIYINDELKVVKDNVSINLTNNITYIGRNVSYMNTELNGYLEKLVFKTSAIEEENQQSVVTMLMNANYLVEHIYEVDKLGRIKNKKTQISTGTFNHHYTYDKSRLTNEIFYNTESREYRYDNDDGNVSDIIVTKQGVTQNIEYRYDLLNRLVYVNDGNNEVDITYDQSGNIVSRVQKDLTSLAITSNKQFVYDSTYKDRLLTVYDSVTNKRFLLEYENGHYPARTMDTTTGRTNNIVYEGKRIVSYGNNTYKYNEEGVRIYKKEAIYNGNNLRGYNIHNYTVEGDKILLEVIQTLTQGIIKFEYNYDINGELVSLEYNNQVYFYVRDALGVIHSIIDKNGNVMVSYEYDEWGKVLSVNASNPNHPIAKYNPFRYKGYYYDVETGLFMMGQRYYSPELCRFIQPADVSSLNPHSINGLNLYSYANNNPIMLRYTSYNSSGNNKTFSMGGISQLNISLISSNYSENYTKRSINPLSFSVGLATPENLSTPSWMTVYALYARGSIGWGYTAGDGYSLASFSAGFIDITFSSPKLFGFLSDDNIINPNLYIGVGAVNVHASVGVGVTGSVELASGSIGVQFGDAISFEAKGYIGFGFSFDFTNGFKFGVGLGLGYEFSINIDWYELFNW